ncbi:ATP-binding protein [Paenibacillus motobuensis]|uniref:hybrid sensor histidine kinase/response regulator n=1 Tax=Paenibacillus motobuensis TaxID=295324 RepID=UPI003630EFD9
MKTLRKVILPIFIFSLILTAVRILWISVQASPEHPGAVQGQLDLRDWDFSKNQTLTLDGEWEFYPYTLLMQNHAEPKDLTQDRQFIQVPGNWHSALNAHQASNSEIGYGSYRLRIQVNPEDKQSYSIRLRNITASSEIYVNGVLLGQSGQPASTKKEYTARNAPYLVSFQADQGEIEIVIHAANFLYKEKGGIINSPQFGSSQAIYKAAAFSTGMQWMVTAVLLIHVVFALIFYFMGTRQKALIYFILLNICAIGMLVADDDKLLHILLPINGEWNGKIAVLSYLGTSAFLLHFIRHLLPKYAKGQGYRWYSILYGLVALFVLLAPYEYVRLARDLLLLMYAIPFLTVLALTLWAVIKEEEDSIFLLLSATSLTTNVIWGILKSQNLEYYPIDIIVTFLALSAFWFKRHFRIAAKTEQLAGILQDADRRKDEFLANTSHELRNPLHGMLNIAENVLHSDKSVLSPKDAQQMELLLSVGRRMSYLLNDLLDLTRLREQGIRLQPSPVRIQAVASGVFDMLAYQVENKPVRFITEIPESLPPVLADENRLVQIIFNLVHNAVKFTHEGSIIIHSEIKGEKAYIHVTDTGIGMDEKAKQRIFEPYEQGEQDLAVIDGGIGLGLHICRQLVELHGGILEVDSAPGRGSTFTFDLPVLDSSVQPAAAETAASDVETRADMELPAAPESQETSRPTHSIQVSDKASILAVDDDPVNLNILIDLLSEESYEVFTATNASQALSILDSREWDLIIADVMMPQMSGYELTRIIRERFTLAELPILLLTARTRAEDIETGFQSGANDYVAKPMDAMELRARVRALTGIKQSFRRQLQIETACLQAQIQPHFLFNTLNSISALSEFDLTRMRTLLDVFGLYLQASFDFQNLNRFVTLKHELELVRSYLYIEQERFEERLQIEWDLDEHLSLQLPPLTIQPLVENAVRHGVLGRLEGGTVQIRILDQGDFAEISVIDNGVGMDEETLGNLLQRKPDQDFLSRSDPASKRRPGIGLYNTDRRLKQIYGKGLQFKSKRGIGTQVSFIVWKSNHN